MNTETQTFNFNSATLRTLTDENGDPWFVAKDVCDILGLNNVGQALTRLDDDEKSSITLNDGTTGTPNKAIVSESGLYSLTLASRKPEAKELKRYVTNEVLPSIRKHGARKPLQASNKALTSHETTTQSFVFNGTQIRTLTDENGNPLFCAKDVATILGYANPAKAVINHCKGFPIWKPLESAGGIQRARFINEGDMYRLIVSSKLPSAEQFERWVYDEVLPSIRKHGAYMTQQTLDKALTSPDFLIQLATKLKEEQEKVKALEPKAKALDAFTNVEDRLLVRDAAKILSNAGTPISEKQLREWMTANDWIYKHNGSWHATAKHCTAGHLVMVMSQKHGTKADGTTFAFPPTVRITRKGLALLHTRLGETRLNEILETTTH
jgi:anti-repressor protein